MAKNRYLYTGNPPPEGAEANISAAGLLWRHTHGLITPKNDSNIMATTIAFFGTKPYDEASFNEKTESSVSNSVSTKVT